MTREDYDRPTTYCASFEKDGNDPDTIVVRVDVTNVVAFYEGRDVGFRVKLNADPEIDFMRFAGSGFGDLYTNPPTIEVRLA